ncbi:putative peptidase u61 ld-carboxypeptidase a protein [Phaeoacremonium minimum UCRPA7]|uniref:Putative peptidase u61 ld-carboxypeptidase a protein n=1 Tax=Phaeoacremonium minimum (strain UCR-PA7) TaxID=1286976 RepID=R8BST5_PHAM7|nr:putative peptidase u61 ld-carboxypeptidase a protein [Phaeoacremonium minimum UCRPA7]EOO02442.1 putative peptidase u61 ld-carboxypeptidase a protein [Phaeoacremonium minimum UCRPA7]
MPQTTVIPKALRPGGTIGFISPSARLNEIFAVPTARAKAALENRGFKVKIFWTHEDPENTTVQQHITHRKQEILDAFADKEVDAIIATIGGLTCSELVPHFINDETALETLRSNPKIFVGYSDITTLHWLLHKYTGLRTFYGPTALPELGEFPKPMDFTIDNLIRTIVHDPATGAAPQAIGPVPRSMEWAPYVADFFLSPNPASEKPSEYVPTPGWEWLHGGKVTDARIFGGCISLVQRLQGIRPIVPDWKGRVLFLEASLGDDNVSGISLERTRQQFADIVAQGVVDDIKGLVFGRFAGYRTEEQRQVISKLIREVFIENDAVTNDFPILINVDIGHTSPILTIPMDALVSLDSEKDEFVILEAGIR